MFDITQPQIKSRLKLARIILFFLIAIPISVAVYSQISKGPSISPINGEIIHSIFKKNSTKQPLSKTESFYWERFKEPTIIVERLGADIQFKFEKNDKYLDTAYLEAMLSSLDIFITNNPVEMLHLLEYYSQQNNHPFLQAISLIILREKFAKKYSLLYASQLAHSENMFSHS